MAEPVFPVDVRNEMEALDYRQLAALFSAGLVLALAGGANLALCRTPGHWRVVATLLIVGCLVAVVQLLSGDARTVEIAAMVTTAGIAACVICGSRPVIATGAAILAALRRPTWRWGVLAVAGLATAVGSVVVHDIGQEADLERMSRELEEVAATPPSRAPSGVRAFTDMGSPVPLSEATDPRPVSRLAVFEDRMLRDGVGRAGVIRREPVADRSNCHGWVFTGGRYWVDGSAVDLILAENDYHPVEAPHPDDLTVYRSGKQVLHTAIVRYVTPHMPVIVEGKWGCIGVYMHPVESSPYGMEIAYYRSPRDGHLLSGLGGPSTDPVVPAERRE